VPPSVILQVFLLNKVSRCELPAAMQSQIAKIIER